MFEIGFKGLGFKVIVDDNICVVGSYSLVEWCFLERMYFFKYIFEIVLLLESCGLLLWKDVSVG